MLRRLGRALQRSGHAWLQRVPIAPLCAVTTVRSLGVKSRVTQKMREEKRRRDAQSKLSSAADEASRPKSANTASGTIDAETEAGVRDGVNAWIRGVVLPNSQCPFAAKSSWDVRVRTVVADDFFDAAKKVKTDVDELMDQAECMGPWPNRFIVWPADFRDQEEFDAFREVLGVHIPGLIDGAGEYTGAYFPSASRVVAMPFHPDVINPCLASPWPMLHLIPVDILRKARQGLGIVKIDELLGRNEAKFLAAGGAAEIRKLDTLRLGYQAKSRQQAFVYAPSIDAEERLAQYRKLVDPAHRIRTLFFACSRMGQQ